MENVLYYVGGFLSAVFLLLLLAFAALAKYEADAQKRSLEHGSVEVERDVKGEYCSQGCSLAALKALVDEVQGAPLLNVVA